MPNLTDNDSLKRLAIALPHWRLVKGDAHSTGEHFTGIQAGNSKSLLLKNESEQQYYGIINLDVRVSAEARVDKSFNGGVTTGGEPPETGITNKRTSGNGTTADVQVGGDNETGTFTSGNEFNAKGVGAGNTEGTASPGDMGARAFNNVIDPGDNLLISVTNTTSTSMAYITIDIDWAEIPSGEYPV